jgi:hypothetical protein
VCHCPGKRRLRHQLRSRSCTFPSSRLTHTSGILDTPNADPWTPHAEDRFHFSPCLLRQTTCLEPYCGTNTNAYAHTHQHHHDHNVTTALEALARTTKRASASPTSLTDAKRIYQRALNTETITRRPITAHSARRHPSRPQRIVRPTHTKIERDPQAEACGLRVKYSQHAGGVEGTFAGAQWRETAEEDD